MTSLLYKVINDELNNLSMITLLFYSKLSFKEFNIVFVNIDIFSIIIIAVTIKIIYQDVHTMNIYELSGPEHDDNYNNITAVSCINNFNS